ncbi:uncharacterized protein LOC119690163 [Teleopsis dalmanni]|uniref:uncharacterized protein LOC119690163 n=1 Tax=Teleopsis dalmanni TaxID=139649 RepID=UPI0018CFC229|nr:uncharacterized protein LOC119690163 [Teleopsis dalmanni]
MWTLLVTICIIYNYCKFAFPNLKSYIVDRLSNLTSSGNVFSMFSIDRELWVTLLTFAMFLICIKLCETFLQDILQMQPELLHIHNFPMPIMPLLEQFPVQHQHFQQIANDELGGGDAQILIQDSESESGNDDDVDEYFLEY